ncbi:MAG: SAM-dependent chlorinase/fluorinase [Bacteroidetes bacterium]|nr:SAM-dependent chlorinase/fluorinase [Bacteroidota bacterium]
MSSTHHHIIALLTDFGLNDHYVGVLKAVLLARNDSLVVVDISHTVEPGNTLEGAFLLWASYKYFPNGTIFVCVVDPGVGTDRRLLCMQTEKYIFLAPDNGLLDWVRYEQRTSKVFALDFRKCKTILPGVISSTFHGRDILAPVAAALTQGYWINELCTKVALDSPLQPLCISKNTGSPPRVVHIDRFGNISTNIFLGTYEQGVQCVKAITLGSCRIEQWVRTYGDAEGGTPVLLIGSCGVVEIAMNRKSAARELNISLTTPVVVEWH